MTEQAQDPITMFCSAEQAQDPMGMFTSAANHADQLVREAYEAIVMVRDAYEATAPGRGRDGRAATTACAIAVVNAARELSDALWTVVEATKENAEVMER